MEKITVTGDGSCSGNPGPGGWAVYVETDDGRVFKEEGGNPEITTNNRMELKAIIEGVRIAVKLCPTCQIEVFSDSKYVINSMNGGWARKQNVDLWAEMNELDSNKITWQHVPRNSTDAHQDCDRRAKIETKKIKYAKKEDDNV